MSLVNQMLRDLEQRRAQLPGGDRLQGLRAAPDNIAATTWKRWPLLLIAAGVAGSGFGWWLANHETSVAVPMARVEPVITVPTLAAHSASAANTHAGVALPAIETATVAALETTAAQQVYPKPTPAGNSPKAAPRSVPESDSKPAPKADPKPDSRPHRLPVTAIAAATTSAGNTGAMRKTPRTLSPHEQATQQYNTALQALAQNEILQAETALRAALAADPGHTDACETLATLMLQQGRRDDAVQLLAAALEHNPRQARLAMLQARLLADAGQDAEAVTVLEGALGDADADYQALLGALQQRLGNDAQAAVAYRQALAGAPQRGTWWLGLGISLERSRQPTAALDAYRNALRDTTLTAQVSDYVRARIAALGSGQG